MNKRIARDIMGWEQANTKLWWADGMNPREFTPSTNIADAIAALKLTGLSWRLEWNSRTKEYFITIWTTPLLYVEKSGAKDCEAICHTLLDKRVVQAVREARKAAKK